MKYTAWLKIEGQAWYETGTWPNAKQARQSAHEMAEQKNALNYAIYIEERKLP